ncbi:MAG: metalloregulator ArsR/SmtB family transcription factor [Pseudomonadota bacterium]
MQTTESATALTPIFAALGDATRLQLVNRLADGRPQSIAQLASGLDITHQGVTKHLKVMEKAGLVRAKRVGRERRYSCEPKTMNAARQYLDEVARQWDEALLRLQDFVENK